MINIQKQVLLLSEFHFKEFSEYLLNINADLPYKLVTTIRHSTINAYYFKTQYLTNQRKQYVEKLKSTFDEARDFEHVRALIDELVRYYKIPVNL